MKRCFLVGGDSRQDTQEVNYEKERDIIYTWTDATSIPGLGAFYTSELQTTIESTSSFSISMPTCKT